MDPAEIEFLAEDERVRIVPNFNEGTLYLIEGDVGPFRAGQPVEVPLWVALNLRQRQKCRLLQPDWMTPDRLESVREDEKDSQFFTRLPANGHMFAVAQLVLDVALADLTHADRVKSIVKDIWDVRQAKLRKSVNALVQSGQKHAKLDHLELIELNAVRPLLPHTLDQIQRLEVATAAVARRRAAATGTGSTSQSSSFLSGADRSSANNTMY